MGEPCPKCGRDCYGEVRGPANDRYLNYYCTRCNHNWREQTAEQRRIDDDLERLRRSPTSDPTGDTHGIPNSDSYQ